MLSAVRRTGTRGLPRRWHPNPSRVHASAYCNIQIRMKCKFYSRNLYWAILFPEISPPLISLLGEIPLGLEHLFHGFLYSPHLLPSPLRLGALLLLQAEEGADLPAGRAAEGPPQPGSAQSSAIFLTAFQDRD